MKLPFTLKLLIMAVWLLAALAVSHFYIYKPFVVPQLSYQSAPLLHWLAVVAPIMIVCIGFGFGLKSLRQLIIFAITAGLVIQAFSFVMARWNEPGYLKTYESAFSHWTVLLLVAAVESAFLFLIGMLPARLARRGSRQA